MRRPTPLILLVLSSLLLAACGGGGAGEPGDPDPSGVTVTGSLLLPGGAPASGMQVVIAGESRTTSVSGSFQVVGVEIPYDLMIDVESFDAVLVYQGLTTAEPVLQLPLTLPTVERDATINFQASGFDATPPAPEAGHSNGDYLVCGGAANFLGCTGVGIAQTSAAVRNVTWFGPATVQAKVMAVQGTVLDTQPRLFTEYSHFAYSANRQWTSDQTITHPLVFNPVGTGHITGTTTVPTGYSIRSRGLGLTSGDERWSPISFEQHSSAPIAADFSFAAPEGIGFGYYVSTRAELGESFVEKEVQVADANATGLSILLPEPPRLLQPTAGQAGISTSTTFSWTPMEEGLYLYMFAPDVGSDPTADGSPGFVIITTDTQVNLPDTSPLGIALPSATPYFWMVQAIAPVGSVDELANGVVVETMGDTLAMAAARKVTTAP